MPIERGENPAAVVYKDDGKLVYSLWMGGTVRTSSSPDGPFVDIKGFSYPGGNPAPIYHNGGEHSLFSVAFAIPVLLFWGNAY